MLRVLMGLLACLSASSPAEASDYEDLIKSIFKNSILKVEVSNNAPIFDDKGVNICRSEGTGFLISSQYVITAEHVFHLSPKCAKPVIVLQTRLPDTQRAADVVESYNDVALLKINEPLPAPICALRVLASDVYASKGLRFGIPHDLHDPHAVPIDIGDKDNEFSPMVVLTPTITEPGESGGPVIYQFNVVGITRARSEVHIGYSFMEAAANIRYLMKKHGVSNDGKTCNPAELFMFNAEAGASGVGVEVSNDLNGNQKSRVLDNAAQALASTIGDASAALDVVVSQSQDTLYIQNAHAKGQKIDLPSVAARLPLRIEKNIWDEFLRERAQ
jgi:hypothetical protein